MKINQHDITHMKDHDYVESIYTRDKINKRAFNTNEKPMGILKSSLP